jgi:hypothetical protein
MVIQLDQVAQSVQIQPAWKLPAWKRLKTEPFRVIFEARLARE